MKAYLFFPVILLTVGLLGCKPKITSVTATGQIFIVTRGADNIKLGAVEVLLIEQQQAHDLLRRKQPVIASTIASRQAAYKLAKDEHEKIFAAYSGDRTSTKLYQETVVAERRRDAAKEKHDENFPTGEDYFVDFSPAVVQKTFSDAEGRFSLTYSRDKSFALYAKAQRTVLNETERYYWLVNAPTNSESAQVFLSNNNLVFVDPDGFFEVKPK